MRGEGGGLSKQEGIDKRDSVGVHEINTELKVELSRPETRYWSEVVYPHQYRRLSSSITTSVRRSPD